MRFSRYAISALNNFVEWYLLCMQQYITVYIVYRISGSYLGEPLVNAGKKGTSVRYLKNENSFFKFTYQFRYFDFLLIDVKYLI